MRVGSVARCASAIVGRLFAVVINRPSFAPGLIGVGQHATSGAEAGWLGETQTKCRRLAPLPALKRIPQTRTVAMMPQDQAAVRRGSPTNRNRSGPRQTTKGRMAAARGTACSRDRLEPR